MTEGRKGGLQWYDVAYGGVLLLLLAAVVWYVERPKVAIVDIERAAEELGEQRRITGQVDARKTATMQRVQEIRKQLERDALELTMKLDDSMKESEKTALRMQLIERQNIAQQSVDELAKDLSQYRNQLVLTFSDTLRSVVRKVAKAKGLDLVVEGGSKTLVLYSRGRVDITDDVIEEARGVFPGGGGPGAMGPERAAPLTPLSSVEMEGEPDSSEEPEPER